MPIQKKSEGAQPWRRACLWQEQAFEQRVRLAADFVQAANSANGALAGAREFIAIRLNQLNLGVTAGLGEFCEHEKSISKREAY
jgi:hypothetical protein